MLLEWNEAELLQSDTAEAVLALAELSDQLRCPGWAAEEIDTLLPVLFRRLESAENYDLQEALIYALEQVYYHQKHFKTSVAPLIPFLKRTGSLFAERVLALVWWSRETVHYEILSWALSSPDWALQRQAQSVVEQMSQAGDWPL